MLEADIFMQNKELLNDLECELNSVKWSLWKMFCEDMSSSIINDFRACVIIYDGLLLVSSSMLAYQNICYLESLMNDNRDRCEVLKRIEAEAQDIVFLSRHSVEKIDKLINEINHPNCLQTVRDLKKHLKNLQKLFTDNE